MQFVEVMWADASDRYETRWMPNKAKTSKKFHRNRMKTEYYARESALQMSEIAAYGVLQTNAGRVKEVPEILFYLLKWPTDSGLLGKQVRKVTPFEMTHIDHSDSVEGFLRT